MSPPAEILIDIVGRLPVYTKVKVIMSMIDQFNFV